VNPWDQLIMTPVRIAQTEKGRIYITPGPTRPWGLTPTQIAVLTALVELGSPRAVSERLGKSINTVEEQCRRARQKMGAKSNTEAAVMWDRLQRPNKPA
jgi:DNA-binding CsgD family transcriptional regulator